MVETPRYEILERLGRVEIRQYPDLILATTRMEGRNHDTAAFRIVAGYIFGNNSANLKIAMTAPVITSQQGDVYTMSFVLPQGRDLAMLPSPSSDRVHLEKREAARFAVIRFSGRSTASKVRKYAEELRDTLKRADRMEKGEVLLLRYNPPWTLPMFRRNELAVELL